MGWPLGDWDLVGSLWCCGLNSGRKTEELPTQPADLCSPLSPPPASPAESQVHTVSDP